MKSFSFSFSFNFNFNYESDVYSLTMTGEYIVKEQEIITYTKSKGYRDIVAACVVLEIKLEQQRHSFISREEAYDKIDYALEWYSKKIDS